MDSDETKFLPGNHSNPERKKTENEPFEFGDRTIFNLRNQDFDPSEEFGTVVLKPQHHEPEPSDTPQEEPGTPSAEHALSDDPLVRIEQKLDAALRQIHSLQQRLESLDATIARSLLR